MRYRESERGSGEDKDVCLLRSFAAIFMCRSPWESPLAFTLKCVHSDMCVLRLIYTKTCTRDLSGCARHIVNLVLKGPETYRFISLINIELFFMDICVMCVMWKKLLVEMRANCIFQQTMDMLKRCPFMFSVFCCVYNL